MKINIEIEFLETVFPPKQVRQLMDCLNDVKEGRMQYGKIELSIAEGSIKSIVAVNHYEK